MAGRSGSTDPRAERVRAQMKAAALELIHERRVEAISVSDIVERAGVSRPAFYQHFDDRDDAITAALAANFPTVDAALAPDEVIDALLKYAQEHSELYFNLYPSVVSQRSTQAFRALLRPACAQLVAELWGERDGGPSREVLTTFLLGGILEIITDWVAKRTDGSPAPLVEELMRAFRDLAK